LNVWLPGGGFDCNRLSGSTGGMVDESRCTSMVRLVVWLNWRVKFMRRFNALADLLMIEWE
jgi:hypothetical protein